MKVAILNFDSYSKCQLGWQGASDHTKLQSTLDAEGSSLPGWRFKLYIILHAVVGKHENCPPTFNQQCIFRFCVVKFERLGRSQNCMRIASYLLSLLYTCTSPHFKPTTCVWKLGTSKIKMIFQICIHRPQGMVATSMAWVLHQISIGPACRSHLDPPIFPFTYVVGK